jgi:hypothetical protein
VGALIDNLNSYADGLLGGNGTWSVAGVATVQGVVTSEGAKAAKITQSGSTERLQSGTFPGGPHAFGTQSVDHRVAQTDGISQAVLIQDGDVGSMGNITFDEDGYIYIQGGAGGSNQIQAYSADTWYQCEIEWRPTDTGGEIRGRIDGGTWTSWYTSWSDGVREADGLFMRVPPDENGDYYWDNYESTAVNAVAEPMVLTTSYVAADTPVFALDLSFHGKLVENPIYEFNLEIDDEGKVTTVGGAGGGSFKPWLSKTFLDIHKSSLRDYPPKRKKPWMTDSFPAMEHYHYDNFTPFGTKDVDAVNCGNRTLQVIIEPWNLDCEDRNFTVRAVGQVFGDLTWHISADEEDELSDAANIRTEGEVQVLLDNCAGTPPEILTFIAIDDCGFAAGNLSIDGCPGIVCDTLPTLTCASAPCDEVNASTTKQYNLLGAKGVPFWSVSGTDATIDQTGLLTTGASACGMLTISVEDCCGLQTQTVRVLDNSFWGNDTLICDGSTGLPEQSCIIGKYKYRNWQGATCTTPCFGGIKGKVRRQEWLCA